MKGLPGARIPTDGSVVEGTSYVDESMLTGESGGVAAPLLLCSTALVWLGMIVGCTKSAGIVCRPYRSCCRYVTSV